MIFTKIKHAVVIACAVTLMVLVLLNTVTTGNVVTKGPGKGEKIQTVEQFLDFLSYTSGRMNFGGVSLAATPVEHKLLSSSGVFPNGLGQDSTNLDGVSSDYNRYTSWTVDTGVTGYISQSAYYDGESYNTSMDITANMTMAITEFGRYLSIKDAFVNVTSKDDASQVKYDAEVLLMGDLAIIKYNKFIATGSINLDISDEFFGKWFYLDSFDNSAAEQLQSVLGMGLDTFFTGIDGVIEDAMEEGSIIRNGNKYTMPFSDSGAEGELRLDLSQKDRPSIDMWAGYSDSNNGEMYNTSYSYNNVMSLRYTMVFSEINNTVVNFPNEAIYSNPTNYIREVH